MAAYDIQKHFQGLRVDTGRRRGRRDPFATGFEDDSDDDRPSRAPKKAPPVQKPSLVGPPKDTISSPFAAIDALRDSDDDFVNFTTSKTQRKTGQRDPSPAPIRVTNGNARRGSIDNNIGLPVINRNPRTAVALAAGPLAYLDDSDEDDNFLQPARRADRRPSPAPRNHSDPSDPHQRTGTPRGGERGQNKEHSLTRLQPPRHTVASPFAGTKYLEDSDSDNDGETAVASRKNSAEPESSPDENVETNGKQLEVRRVDKPKQNGSGVSWRAFSASRSEQRSAEVEALQARLRQRGRTISFSPHATTDDGKRIPVSPTIERAPLSVRGRGSRGKSPPRRAEDTRPSDEEITDGGFPGFYDPVEYKTNPFTATTTGTGQTSGPGSFITTSRTSSSIISPKKNDSALPSPDAASGASVIATSLAAKLTVSPQTIPETAIVDHAMSPVASPLSDEPRSPLSRHGSYRSVRTALASSRPARIPATSSRRSSRRSTSTQTSISPAHAFLSSWSRVDQSTDLAAEPDPDDEGQAIGLNDEYIIGRVVDRGGFGVVKEVHTINEHGHNVTRAVKIVRKSVPGLSEIDNEKLQQALEHEVSVWRYLKHRHILGLHAVYDTEFATFCVMDLNIGGTLFDLVRKARSSAAENNGRKGLPAHLARTYSYQLACALRYLHEDIRVCHRDVKLENCLVDLSDSNALARAGNVRLCDFGLADFLSSDQNYEDAIGERYTERLSLSTELPVLTAGSVIGTLEYASPKGLTVNRKLYETAGDIWAFGVVVYALCTGDLPFRHPIPSKTAELIIRAEWDDDALRQAAAAGGGEVIDLVKGCLEREIDMRFTISEVLRSDWFNSCREADEDAPRGGWK